MPSGIPPFCNCKPLFPHGCPDLSGFFATSFFLPMPKAYTINLFCFLVSCPWVYDLSLFPCGKMPLTTFHRPSRGCSFFSSSELPPKKDPFGLFSSLLSLWANSPAKTSYRPTQKSPFGLFPLFYPLHPNNTTNPVASPSTPTKKDPLGLFSFIRPSQTAPPVPSLSPVRSK